MLRDNGEGFDGIDGMFGGDLEKESRMQDM